MSLLVSSRSSAWMIFCASSGFFSHPLRQFSVGLSELFREFAVFGQILDARNQNRGRDIASHRSRIFPPDSRSSRETHGSMVQTASTFFCWNNAS